MTNQIGELGEKSLHAAIKTWYGRADDQFEVPLDGFVIDIVRGDQLIEKLADLLAIGHPVLLLHPIPQQKWIVRQTKKGEKIGRRKSPKRGQPLDIFRELVRIPHLLSHPNLTIGILLTQQEEVWRDDGQGSWRRKGWSVYDHRLLDVVAEHQFTRPHDFLRLLPTALPQPFTNRQLAKLAGLRLRLAQRVTYTLSRCGAMEQVGKKGRAHTYQFVVSSGDE